MTKIIDWIKRFKFRIYLSLAAIAVGFIIGWQVHGVFYDASKVKDLEDQLSQSKANYQELFTQSEKNKEELAKLKKNADDNKQAVNNEVKSNPVYSNTFIPNNGVRLINEAINARVKP